MTQIELSITKVTFALTRTQFVNSKLKPRQPPLILARQSVSRQPLPQLQQCLVIDGTHGLKIKYLLGHIKKNW
jgi:hypothetical protein